MGTGKTKPKKRLHAKKKEYKRLRIKQPYRKDVDQINEAMGKGERRGAAASSSLSGPSTVRRSSCSTSPSRLSRSRASRT